jgi:phosphotransferase system  glucose/maltose/N-acetylglucosamine-specific IIC component
MIPVVGAFYFLIYFFFLSWIIRRYEPTPDVKEEKKDLSKVSDKA